MQTFSSSCLRIHKKMIKLKEELTAIETPRGTLEIGQKIPKHVIIPRYYPMVRAAIL